MDYINRIMAEIEIQNAKTDIDSMSQEAMASLWRFAPSGHPYFDARNFDLYEYFRARFKEKGGMTPAISKSIGW
jgi:hypothetical protein